MKKYVSILIVAILVGGLIAYFFYRDINKEVRAITKKEDVLYLFQVGVFKDKNNAYKLKETFKSALVYQDNDYYRVIIGAAYHKEAKAKLESLYLNQEINFYIKEVRVNNNLIDKISNYENILIKSNKEEVIYNINNSILQTFDSYIN